MKRFLFATFFSIFLFQSCLTEKTEKEIEENVVIKECNIPLTTEELGNLLGKCSFIKNSESKAPYIEIMSNENIKIWSTNNLLVLAFYTTTCGPCMVYLPFLQSYALNCDYSNIYFGQCDAASYPELAIKYNIHAVPTTIFIKNSTVLASAVGVINSSTLDALISQYKDILVL